MQMEVKNVFQSVSEKEKREKVLRIAEEIIKQRLKEGKRTW